MAAILSLQGAALPAATIAVHTAEAVAAWQFAIAMAVMFGTAVWLHRTLLHPYIFFLMTTALFIGGRLVAYLLGYHRDPIFWIAPNQSFHMTPWPAAEIIEVMSVVMPILLATHAGYFAFWAFREGGRSVAAPPSASWQRTLVWPAMALLVIAFPLAAYGVVTQLLDARQAGYLAAYASTTEFSTRWANLGQYGVLLSLGLAFASGNRPAQWACVFALGVVSAVAFVIGIRSSFISFVILAAWFVHLRVWRIPLWAAVALPVTCVILAQGALAFSTRTDMAAGAEVAESFEARNAFFREALTPSGILWFVRGQGTTLLYVPLAMEAAPYPWPAFVQTFIPGFGAAASLTGNPIPIEELYFGQHLAKTQMPEGFARGEGLGWSIVMDMLVFARENVAFASVLAAAFGFAFATLVNLSGYNAIWFGAMAVLLPKIVLLPRTGLYSIFPYLLTFLGMVAGWWLFLQALHVLRLRNASSEVTAMAAFEDS